MVSQITNWREAINCRTNLHVRVELYHGRWVFFCLPTSATDEGRACKSVTFYLLRAINVAISPFVLRWLVFELLSIYENLFLV